MISQRKVVLSQRKVEISQRKVPISQRKVVTELVWGLQWQKDIQK